MDNDELERRVQAALKAERAKNPDPPPNWETLEILIRERIRREMQEEVVRLIGLPKDEDTPPSTAEFCEMDWPERKPVLGPFSTQQLTFIYAPTGHGKTMFGLQLAWCIAEGQDFLGWTSQRSQRVLYVDGEMVADDMKRRLDSARSKKMFLANICSWAADRGIEPPNLTEEAGQNLVTSWILKLDAEVIVLDNLMSLAWMDGVSMNSDELWQPTRRWCVDQRSAGRSVILIDHTNAAGQIFGSKTKLWHVDNALKLEEAEDFDDQEEVKAALDLRPPRRTLSLTWEKQRGAIERWPDLLVKVGSVGADWGTQITGDALKERAIEMKKDGMTVREIAADLGLTPAKVGRWTKGVVSRVVPDK